MKPRGSSLEARFGPADIFLSWSDSFVGRAISWFQRRGGAPSHVGVMTGLDDAMAEATMPRGRISHLSRYFDPHHRLEVWKVPHWTLLERRRIVQAACALAVNDYDKLNIARHLFDNAFERIGLGRPLARLIGDHDAYGRNVCSELVGWAVHFGTSELRSDVLTHLGDEDWLRRHFGTEIVPVQPVGARICDRVGQARPADVVTYLKETGSRCVFRTRGTEILLDDTRPRV